MVMNGAYMPGASAQPLASTGGGIAACTGAQQEVGKAEEGEEGQCSATIVLETGAHMT
jgi:hypothetical protein